MPAEQTWDLLARAPVGRVGTTGPEGWPYIAPVSHVVLDGSIYFHHLARGGHLNTNLAADDRVCFEVDEQLAVVVGEEPGCETSIAYRSAVVMGRAARVEDEAIKAAVCAALVGKYVPGADVPAERFLGRMGGIVVYAVAAERVTGKQSIEVAQ